MVLSYIQATALLAARANGVASVVSSPDLGLTTCTVSLDERGVGFPDETPLSWDLVTEICAHENACFRAVDGAISPIREFSELTGLAYSLMPTSTAPTMLISGTLMHRIKDTDPRSAASAMVAAIAPIRGAILDTATGLGYTAIEEAKTADSVVTIELDPAAQNMARANPWSRALFDNAKITQKIGDSSEVIREFGDAAFSCILHDPPVLSMAGDLYSGEFYRQAFRVLKPKGRMFHYIGDPHSPSGALVTKGVIRRLGEAGFTNVVPRPEAFGVVALK
jgi:hypothetical protein